MTHIPVFVSLVIQTNSRCNLKCPFCFYGQDREYGGGAIMETSVIHKIFDDLADMDYTGRLSLYNMNEPLTDHRIIDLLKAAKEQLPACCHTLSTNGVLLTQPLLDELLIYLDRLRINCYSSVPDLNYSDHKIDYCDKRRFRSAAENNRGGNLKNLPAVKGPATGPCANPFAQMVIMPPGKVVLCCSDGYQRVILGDVKYQSVSDIWNGSAFTAVRDALVARKRNRMALCRNCSISGGGFFEYFEDPRRYDRLMKNYLEVNG